MHVRCTMLSTDELIEDLDRDKLEAARRMRPGEKLLAGPRLFDFACKFALADIRRRNPDATQDRLIELLRERVQIGLELEDTPWTPKPSPSRS
jgi:hypothetical protein